MLSLRRFDGKLPHVTVSDERKLGYHSVIICYHMYIYVALIAVRSEHFLPGQV